MLKKIIIILIVCFISCSKKNNVNVGKDATHFSEFFEEKNVQFENLIEFTSGVPRMMNIEDSTLMMAFHGSGQKYCLQNYSIKTGELSKQYISKGRGPGEILGMNNFGVTGDKLWINDNTAKKMTLFDKNKIMSKFSSSDYKEYPYKNGRPFYSILTKDLRCILTGSETSKYKIQILDLTNSKIIDEIGILPQYSNKIPSSVIRQATIAHSFLKPTEDKIALGYAYTDVVEVYDLKTKQRKIVQGPENFDSHYKILNEEWFFTKKTRYSFMGGDVTDSFIYLIYSGKKYEEEKSYEGKYVFVYDWNLNPIKKITMDIQTQQICVSEDDKIIYSYNDIAGYIVKAKLP